MQSQTRRSIIARSQRGNDMLRTSLLSGLILDAILLAYIVITGLLSTIRHWESPRVRLLA